MFELDFTVKFLKAASADFRFGNGEVFPSDDGTLVCLLYTPTLLY